MNVPKIIEAIQKNKPKYKFIKSCYADSECGRCMVGLLLSAAGWKGHNRMPINFDLSARDAYWDRMLDKFEMTTGDAAMIVTWNDKKWNSFEDAEQLFQYMSKYGETHMPEFPV